MRAIVSFANERGNYIQALQRLEESLKHKTDAKFFGFIGEDSIGAPKHEDNNYAFKLYAIEEVLKQGYDQILYLDSSCYAIKDLRPIFYDMRENGFFAQYAGHMCGSWANQKQLDFFKVTPGMASVMPMYGNAGMLGLNFNNTATQNFYAHWFRAMSLGIFNGSWEDSRHDMVCGSIIANRMGLDKLFKKGDEWLQYKQVEDEPQNETILIGASGM